MTQTSFSHSEIQLLKKEVEALGDSLAQERLERVAENGKLRLELEAIKLALQQVQPDFLKRYQEAYSDLVQNFNPEAKAG